MAAKAKKASGKYRAVTQYGTDVLAVQWKDGGDWQNIGEAKNTGHAAKLIKYHQDEQTFKPEVVLEV